jgi:hypothetical protein
LVTHASHWRILLSPAGPGHALFLLGEVTGGRAKVYSDNIALARWLQGEAEGSYTPEFKDQGLPVAEAAFTRHGDVRSSYTERIASWNEDVSLTWYDFGDPFLLNIAPGNIPNQPHGVYSVFIPARGAQLVVNGQVAQGRPIQQERPGYTSSSCCLAWSETWVRPR